MWGSKASDWNDNPVRAGSMKWHLVDEDSFEERDIEIGWGDRRRTVKRTYGLLMCGGHKQENRVVLARDGSFSYDSKMPLVLKDKINMTQANICAFCKKYRMKQLGIEGQQI